MLQVRVALESEETLRVHCERQSPRLLTPAPSVVGRHNPQYSWCSSGALGLLRSVTYPQRIQEHCVCVCVCVCVWLLLLKLSQCLLVFVSLDRPGIPLRLQRGGGPRPVQFGQGIELRSIGHCLWCCSCKAFECVAHDSRQEGWCSAKRIWWWLQSVGLCFSGNVVGREQESVFLGCCLRFGLQHHQGRTGRV